MKKKFNSVVYAVVYKVGNEVHSFQKRNGKLAHHDHYTTAVKAVKKLNAKLDPKDRHWVALTNIKLADYELIIW